ncbi:hypothetical protein A9Q81_06475 [Gammaproteobacteria bacterium 42_54_T18]|nr:hypothetical protein A9Q81_06475 [Gammaproteobacteria bacterium 42_54_T18]
MPSGNDAGTFGLATINCAYCAVGGLFGKPASEIIQKVYAMMGKGIPSGGEEDGFGLLSYKVSDTKKSFSQLSNYEPLERQIIGMRYFLQKIGASTDLLGTARTPLTFPEAQKLMKGKPEGTRFLAVAGDADMGTFLTTLVHWTVGQVQSGVPTFYDHQLNVTNSDVWKAITIKMGNSGITPPDSAGTKTSTEPLGPLNQELDEDDKRCVIIVVNPA